MRVTLILILSLVTSISHGQVNCGCIPTLLKIEKAGSKYRVAGKVKQKNSNCRDSTKFHGFPLLDCTFSDGYCIHTPDRFLAINGDGDYIVINDSGKVIIGSSDSIIGLTVSGDNLEIPCPQDHYRGTRDVYYQVIRGDSTSLYNYDGNKVFNRAYSGILNPMTKQWYLWVKDTISIKFFITTDLKMECMGLLDSSVREVIPLIYDLIYEYTFINQSMNKYYFIGQEYVFNARSETRDIMYHLIDAQSSKVLIKSYDLYDMGKYDLFIYGADGKLGLYHIKYGRVLKPKYDEIEYDYKSDSVELHRRNKTKSWNIPKKILSGYEQYAW